MNDWRGRSPGRLRTTTTTEVHMDPSSVTRPGTPRRAGWAAARLAVGIVALAACSPSPDSPSPSPSAGLVSDSPRPDASEAVSPSAEPSAGVPGELPAGFPVPPGAGSLAVQPGERIIARWQLNDHGSAAYDHFLRELPAAGFTVEAVAPGGAAASIRFTTPDGEKLQIDLVGTQPVEVELGPPHE
ncbi:MAG TPA: hypothetical protein VHK28_11130 [Candidatus Limnocylindria bacterium]|nr:hypothetical protein [Candidatus Limnocylindria bacterium]